MSRRLKDQRNLQRKSKTRGERSRILIVTEGEETEPQYFRGLSRHLRATGVEVFGVHVVGEGRDPSRVVRKAAKMSDDGALVGDRDGYDSVWCVFDVDEHSRLASAIGAAKKMGFGVAVSNPCFEIWILWHYEEHHGHVGKRDLKIKLRQCGIAGKDLPSSFPYRSVVDAISRVKNRDGDIPANPGSNVWVLAQHMCAGKLSGT